MQQLAAHLISQLTLTASPQGEAIIYYILPVNGQKVYSRIVNIFPGNKPKKVLTFSEKSVEYYKKIAYSLIKSGGGNGPMKPGNLAEC